MSHSENKKSIGPHQCWIQHLWLKLLLAYVIPAGFIIVGVGWMAFRAARNEMERQLGESLISVARTAVVLIGKQRTLCLQKGDEQTRTYNNLKNKLVDLKQATRTECIVVFDRTTRALVDSDSKYAIGERIVRLTADRVELREVYAGRACSSVLFEGREHKLFKTGFAPLWVNGQIAGGVGVDGSAEFFIPLAHLSRVLTLVGAVALVLVIVVTLVVSRTITSPLNRLVQACRFIGRGELEHEIEVKTNDEIGVLAFTLEDMRKSVLVRDNQLQMMLAGIAHEVRNPLGGMTLFVGLLREEVAFLPGALVQVERIASELEYLQRVVCDFLDFARKRPIELDEVDPESEFEYIQNMCIKELNEAQVELVCSIDVNIGRVFWDRERMRRALLNLVRNAIQASSKHTRVQVSVHASLKVRDSLLITICDQGCGIPKDKVEHIFEPFFTTRQKGTGLGLALVRQTVEDHKGDISVVSEVEHGSIFTIRLPRQGC